MTMVHEIANKSASNTYKHFLRDQMVYSYILPMISCNNYFVTFAYGLR